MTNLRADRPPLHARTRTRPPSRSPRLGAAVLFLSTILTACGRHAPPPAPPPPTVRYVVVHPTAVTLSTDLPGRTVAYRTADIRPQVSGILQKRLFVEGSDVKAGQQLYQIDPALFRASVMSAAAALTTAQALVERYRPLAEANAVSHQDLDNAIATAAQDKATLDTAQINLVYTRLLSPITGRIGRSSVTEGALVTADQTVALATVQQLDPIYVDVAQPSAVLLRLKHEFASGQLKHVGAHEAAVHLTLEDGTAYAPIGRLEFTEVTVDETTGSVTLRALFPNHDKLLLPGMFVHEQLDEGQRPGTFLVPQQAVTRSPTGQASAFVIGDGNKIEVRPLETSRALGAVWLVTAGLRDGDRVVVEGLQKSRPGSVVTPQEYQPPPPPTPSATTVTPVPRASSATPANSASPAAN
jgi:membrane fusion protein (multidrug efflux system)